MGVTTQLNTEIEFLQTELEKKSKEEEILRNRLEEIKKEMNQFTYIVSHDLQAPLRTITGFLELLNKRYSDKLDASGMQFIDMAVKGATKMKSLVFDLLEYSRLNNRVEGFDVVDLNEVLNETKIKYETIIEKTGAVIKVNELPLVLADRTQMGHMFHHLLGNALKFRGERTPEINITSRKENNCWIIGVQDNGMGIEESFFEKIFIVFRRLNNDEEKYPGTGIGLAICKKIAELHDGKIWLKSEVNKGTAFYFSLPVKN